MWTTQAAGAACRGILLFLVCFKTNSLSMTSTKREVKRPPSHNQPTLKLKQYSWLLLIIVQITKVPYLRLCVCLKSHLISYIPVTINISLCLSIAYIIRLISDRKYPKSSRNRTPEIMNEIYDQLWYFYFNMKA